MNQNTYTKKRNDLSNAVRTATSNRQVAVCEWIAWEYLNNPNGDFVSTRTDAEGNEYCVQAHKTGFPSISRVAKDRIIKLSKKDISDQDIRRGWEFIGKSSKWIDEVFEIDMDSTRALFMDGKKWSNQAKPNGNGNGKKGAWERECNRLTNMETDKIKSNDNLKAMYNTLKKVFG